jgi:hypothetical protein
VPLAGVGLADEHLDELHPLAVEAVKLPHRVDAAASDRAGVADEVQQDRSPTQVAQPQPASLRGGQLEAGCLVAGGQAGTEQFGQHVPHPEMPEVEVLARVENVDEPRGPSGPAVA